MHPPPGAHVVVINIDKYIIFSFSSLLLYDAFDNKILIIAIYLIVTLQHPFIVLILRVLPGREGGFLLPPVDTEVLRPVDALLPHLDKFRLSRLRRIFLLAFRGRRHLRRHFRLVFVAVLVFVIVTLIRRVLVLVIMILAGFVLEFVIVIVVVIVVVVVVVFMFVIGFMSMIVRVRELRTE